MKVVYTDVLVIGGGLAGLRVAIGARRRGHDAIVLSLVPPKRSHSAAAQGGMQASLGNVAKGLGDNEDVHFEDTVKGSDWGADQQVVRMFVNTAPKAVRELAAWGVPWSRVRQGDRQVIINGQKVTITERGEAHGLVAQRDFGGTKKWRTCYVSDGTGHAMLFAVGDQAIAQGIPVHERKEAIALIHDGSRCYGAVVRDLITGELDGLRRQGHRDRHRRRGSRLPGHDQRGHLRGHRRGAGAGDRRRPARQHGGRAVPPDGHLPGRHPGHRGLPRRRRPAARRGRPPLHAGLRAREEGTGLARRRLAAHGRAHPQGARRRSRASASTCWLDITLLGAPHIEHNLREVKEICQYFLGVDPAEQWIPVRPAQHYTMGGIRTEPHRPEPARCAGCSRPARRPAGTCTASTASAAIPWPRPSSPA